MEIHKKKWIFIFSRFLPFFSLMHNKGKFGRLKWQCKAKPPEITPETVWVCKTNVVHNTVVHDLTHNVKTLQKFKLLYGVGEYMFVLCSVHLFQAGCSKLFVLWLCFIFEWGLFLCSGEFSHQQVMCTVRLLLSMKFHFWGCRFPKWCFGIHQ